MKSLFFKIFTLALLVWSSLDAIPSVVTKNAISRYYAIKNKTHPQFLIKRGVVTGGVVEVPAALVAIETAAAVVPFIAPAALAAVGGYTLYGLLKTRSETPTPKATSDFVENVPIDGFYVEMIEEARRRGEDTVELRRRIIEYERKKAAEPQPSATLYPATFQSIKPKLGGENVSTGVGCKLPVENPKDPKTTCFPPIPKPEKLNTGCGSTQPIKSEPLITTIPQPRGPGFTFIPNIPQHALPTIFNVDSKPLAAYKTFSSISVGLYSGLGGEVRSVINDIGIYGSVASAGILSRDNSKNEGNKSRWNINDVPAKDEDTNRFKTPDSHPEEFVKLKGGQGWKDKDGNIWKIDHKHKNTGRNPNPLPHWDVSNKKGQPLMEVAEKDGKLLWPGGSKGKGSSKVAGTGSIRSTILSRSNHTLESDTDLTDSRVIDNNSDLSEAISHVQNIEETTGINILTDVNRVPPSDSIKMGSNGLMSMSANPPATSAQRVENDTRSDTDEREESDPLNDPNHPYYYEFRGMKRDEDGNYHYTSGYDTDGHYHGEYAGQYSPDYGSVHNYSEDNTPPASSFGYEAAPGFYVNVHAE